MDKRTNIKHKEEHSFARNMVMQAPQAAGKGRTSGNAKPNTVD
jgi:hypothetical protein